MQPDPEAPPREFDIPISSPFAEGLGQSFLEEIPEAEEIDLDGDDPALEFRRTLGMFPTGVTIITTQAEGQAHGMTANAFMSVSLVPPLVLVSVDRRAKMNSLLHEGGRYGISVLGDEQEALDLSQEVFLKVFRTLHQFRGQSALRTWIYRIVINQASNRQRWWRRRRRDQQAEEERTSTRYAFHTSKLPRSSRKRTI